MKLLPFAVIIQWGAGQRYILNTYATEDNAQLAANSHCVFLGNRGTKRGAKPEVSVWERKSIGIIAVESNMADLGL